MRHVVWAMLAMASFAVLGPAFAEPARRAKIATSLPASIFMAEMTWPEVAKALRQGKRAVIIPTGGLEQGGRIWSPANTTISCVERHKR